MPDQLSDRDTVPTPVGLPYGCTQIKVSRVDQRSTARPHLLEHDQLKNVIDSSTCKCDRNQYLALPERNLTPTTHSLKRNWTTISRPIRMSRLFGLPKTEQHTWNFFITNSRTNKSLYGATIFISTGIVTASEEPHRNRVIGGIFRNSATNWSIFASRKGEFVDLAKVQAFKW